MQLNLSPDAQVARRIAFVMAKAAVALEMPPQSRADLLLQAAMERPEAVTPEQFKLVYLMRDRS